MINITPDYTIIPMKEKVVLPDPALTFGNLVGGQQQNATSTQTGQGNSIFKIDPAYGIWLGNATFASAPFRVDMTGNVVANSVKISGGSNVSFSSDTLDTSSKSILKDFTFSPSDYSGAFKSGDITWNATTGAVIGGSGIIIYKKGIVGAAAGVTTFSIDATTGNATFSGNITGSIVTGGTFQTATSGQRIIITAADNFIRALDSSGNTLATFGGSTSGLTQYLDLVSTASTDPQIFRIIANSTTGASNAFFVDFKGYQSVAFQNENTNVYRTTNSVPILDLRQLGTGPGIRFINNNPNSDGKVFDITQAFSTSTEPILKISQNGIISTNFRKILTETNTGITIWISNGTTPNGNLTGTLGDLCLNGALGHPFWCSTAPTTWTQI